MLFKPFDLQVKFTELKLPALQATVCLTKKSLGKVIVSLSVGLSVTICFIMNVYTVGSNMPVFAAVIELIVIMPCVI